MEGRRIANSFVFFLGKKKNKDLCLLLYRGRAGLMSPPLSICPPALCFSLLLHAGRLSQLRYQLLLACVMAQIPFFVVGSPKKIVVMYKLTSLIGLGLG